MKVVQIGDLMWALRRLHGLKARDVAGWLGLSTFQYFLREWGFAEISAAQWLEFCRRLDLPRDLLQMLNARRPQASGDRDPDGDEDQRE